MKSRKPRPTDDQIEAEVLAKRGDPSAWEPLPFVPASTSPRPAATEEQEERRTRRRPGGTGETPV